MNIKCYGIGTDLVEINRIEQLLMRHPKRFIEKILTPKEQIAFSKAPYPARWLAKRWAAKEAVAKALGVGIGAQCYFKDIEISKTPLGQPIAQYHGSLSQTNSNQNFTIHLSLTDEKLWALAYCVIFMESQAEVDYPRI
ncbi:MAG: holo-ACP synthase [Gammaproteobacteria bacterium]|nr:holo-ACP synthase [Gammaproteobacteria bacterium]